MSGDPSGFSLPPGTLEPLKIDPAKVSLAQSAGASIGKKYLMAVCGLIWCLFVLAHLLGNLTIYLGREVFNDYSDHLISMGGVPLIRSAFLERLAASVARPTRDGVWSLDTDEVARRLLGDAPS